VRTVFYKLRLSVYVLIVRLCTVLQTLASFVLQLKYLVARSGVVIMLQAGRSRVHGSTLALDQEISPFLPSVTTGNGATRPSVQSVTREFFPEMKRLEREADPGVMSGLRVRGVITPPCALN
jgi:hypothetical protein